MSEKKKVVSLTMLFKDIPGQNDIKERLIRSVLNNRISHAQLFLGAEGSMKLPMAVAYARFICCTDRKMNVGDHIDADACGCCPSCLKFNNLAHPDLHFIYPTIGVSSGTKPLSTHFMSQWRALWLEKGGIFGLNDWYKALDCENKQPIINAEDCNQIIKTLSYKSYESEYKVMIIWMAEKIFHAAAPKILKILEEPSEKTLFILIAADQSQILSTILSRTQLIRFPKLHPADISQWLITSRKMEVNTAKRAASLSEGNMIKALESIDNEESNNFFFEHFRTWLRYCFKPQASILELVEHSEMLAALGRERQKRFLSYGLYVFRQSYLLGETKIPPEYQSEEATFIKNLVPFVHRGNIEGYETLFNEAVYHIERNANPKILFLDVSLQLVKLIKQPALV